MNKTLNQKIWDRSNLKAQLLLFVGALITANYVVVHNRTEPFMEIIKWRSYPPALIFSTLIALLVGEFIYFMALKAHRDYPKIMYPQKHFLYRVVYALLLPPFVAAFLAGIYFACHSLNIFTETVYFNSDFILVIFMVCIGNVVIEAFFQTQHIFRYDAATDPTESTHYNVAEPDDREVAEAQLRLIKDQKTRSIPKKTYVKRVSEQNDPGLAAIFLRNRKLFGVDKNGEIIHWDDPIGKTNKYLPGNYFGLNSAFIINHENVKSAWYVRDTQSFFVEPDFGLPVEKVSNNRVRDFKVWCIYHGILLPVVGSKASDRKRSGNDSESNT